MATPRSRVRALAKRTAMSVPPVRRVLDDRARLRTAQADMRAQLKAAKARAGELELQLAESRATPANQYDYLFIITYGRSGSTLLQGILDSIPGVLIRGENRDSLHRLFSYQRMLIDSKRTYSAKRKMVPSDSWYGIDLWDEQDSLAYLRELVVRTVLHPEPDTRILGYKEIRWWHNDWREYLAFVQQVFPGARFVINTRNHENVAKSRWWAEKEDPLAILADYEKQLDEMQTILGDHAYRVHFDDYVADPGVLAGLYEWLGEPFDRSAVEAVLSIRHSY